MLMIKTLGSIAFWRCIRLALGLPKRLAVRTATKANTSGERIFHMVGSGTVVKDGVYY